MGMPDLRDSRQSLTGTPLAKRWMDSAGTWLRENWTGLLSLALGGLALGALKAANSADYPTYLAIGIVALAFGTWSAELLKAKETWFWFVIRVGLFFVLAQVLFRPFAPSDRLGSTAIEGWTGSKTVFWAYLFVHGIFLFPIVTYLYLELRRWGWRWIRAAWRALGEWRGMAGFVIAMMLSAMVYIAIVLGVSVIVLAGPLILVSLALMLRPRLPVIERFWMLTVFLALSLSVAVEVVVFKGDISRMNMVFKFYYQIWVLLGIAGAVALGWLWQRASINLPQLSGGWRTAAVMLVTAGLLYTPLAARAKISERFNEGAPPGLDGMAYMKDAVYSEQDHDLTLRWDYDALIWMQDHIAGTPVVAEGQSSHEYLWGGRVSIYTGLPTLFGWQNHQRQQRGVTIPGSLIDQRLQDVALLYGDPSIVTATKILKRYDVKYVYLGELERTYYPPESLAKFDRMAQAGALSVAYQNPGVTIYAVTTKDQ
jgi:YYY domain-containing protein